MTPISLLLPLLLPTSHPTTLQAPEIQSMYTLNIPVSKIRNHMRREFERHRYVSQLPVADVLIMHSHQEFQVGFKTGGQGVESWSESVGRMNHCMFSIILQVDCISAADELNNVSTPLCSFFVVFFSSSLSASYPQETMNFWKQVPHVLKYFEGEENIKGKVPTSFVDSFLQVRQCVWDSSCPPVPLSMSLSVPLSAHPLVDHIFHSSGSPASRSEAPLAC